MPSFDIVKKSNPDNGWQYEIVLDYEARTCKTATNNETRENI